MDWSWLLWQVTFAFLLCFVATRRSRSSMQRYADDLRLAAHELSVQSQQLTVVEEAAKESTKQSTRRAKELQTLHDNASALSVTVETLTAERDAAREEVTFLRSRLNDVSTKLARSDARRDILEKEIAAARLVKLELLSKLRIDEDERLSALNSLRRPTALRAPLIPQGSPSTHSITSETALSPLAVAKSPSESMLLSLHPDLEMSDDEESELNFRQAERAGRELEANMVHKFPLADRLKPENIAFNVRRKLNLPDVKLGKPAVRANAGREERKHGGISKTAGQSSSHEKTTELNRDEVQMDASIRKVGDDTQSLNVRKDGLRRDKTSVNHNAPSNMHSTSHNVRCPDSAGEEQPLFQTSLRVIEPATAEHAPKELRVESLQLDTGIAIDTTENTSASHSPQMKSTRISCQPLIDNIDIAIAKNQTTKESRRHSVDAKSPTDIATFTSSSSGARSSSMGSGTEVESIRTSENPNEPSNFETEGDRFVVLSSCPNSSIRCNLPEDVQHKNKKENVPISKSNTVRRHRSLNFDRDSLSLNRAPWIDTIHPTLQSNEEAMSIAAILHPPIGQTSYCIVPVSTKSHRRTLSGDMMPSGSEADR